MVSARNGRCPRDRESRASNATRRARPYQLFVSPSLEMPAHTNRPPIVGPSAVDTAYTLTLLSEYAYTLDTLPLELSRHYADLRELDAVLSSSMTSIMAKVQRLTTLIEQGNAAASISSSTSGSAGASVVADGTELRTRKEDRLWLLADIADEVSRLKPGAEDKIRVACLAADTLKAHAAHMTALLDQVPVDDYEDANVDRQTVYPHVGKGYAGTALYEVRGKRRAAAGAAAGVLAAHAILESPAKRRRGAREDDDPAYGRSPRKDKTANGRNGARPRKCVLSPPRPALVLTMLLKERTRRLPC
jgi:inhibitor of growth protein 3